MNEEYFVLMWHDNYYDGPLGGVGIYKGQVVKFEIIWDDDDDHRIFKILPMSHNEMVDRFQWHFRFLQTVGWRSQYDLYEKNKRYDRHPYGAPENKPDIKEAFYKPYDNWKKKTKPKYPPGQIIQTIDEEQLRGLKPIN